MLFPLVFPLLSGIAIGTLAAGLVSTLAATFINRRRLDKALQDPNAMKDLMDAYAIKKVDGAAHSEKLKSFTTYLAQELCKSGPLTKTEFQKESAPSPALHLRARLLPHK